MIAQSKIRVSGRLNNQGTNGKSMVSDYDLKIVRTIDLDEMAISSPKFYIFISLSNERGQIIVFISYVPILRTFFERFQKAYRAYGFKIEV